jgi:hypothetical protein
LFGVLCQPDHIDQSFPAIIYLNSGANHHIGWARSTVDVTRRFSSMGAVSFRIDIGGIGDSPDIEGRPDQIIYADEVTADVSAAIDCLEARGFSNFAVIGLCSGAHLAFHSAIADPRIKHAVVINLQRFIWRHGDSLEIAFEETYKSSGFYLTKLFERETWQRLLQGKIALRGIGTELAKRLSKRITSSAIEAAHWFGQRAESDLGRVRAWFHEMEARKVRLMFVYSAGDAGLDELALFMGAHGTKLKTIQGASLAVIEGADHNFTPRSARERLIGLLEEFLCSQTRKRQKETCGSTDSSTAKTGPSERKPVYAMRPNH